MAGTERTATVISELHSFQGKFPTVPTYSIVDTEELYQGDSNPFHIVLAIAEVGKTSSNGLIYTDELVNAMETQLPGKGGLSGHLKDEEMGTAFPIDAVHWVGSLRESKMLYAKAYVPQGDWREYIRQLKARGGQLSTSIFGRSYAESVDAKVGTWVAREFELMSVDLAPADRAALKTRSHGQFQIVSQMSKGGDMPTGITIESVPTEVREQIVSEAQSKMTQKVSELESQVAELVQYRRVVAEITAVIGADVDIAKVVAEYHKSLTDMAQMLGVTRADVNVRVGEYHTNIAELQSQVRNRQIDDAVAEFTPWSAVTETQKEQLKAFRTNLRRAIVGELGKDGDPKQVAQKLWDSEFKTLSQGVVAQLAGPAAIVGSKGSDWRADVTSPDKVAEFKKAWGIS